MNNFTIFAVDDEEGILELYRSILTNETQKNLDFFEALDQNTDAYEYDLHTFLNGEEYLQALQSHYAKNLRVPLSIIDMRLPGMHGLEIAKEAKKIDSEMIIVIVSAYADFSIKELIGHLEKNLYYLRKPFRHDEFNLLVHTSLMQWNDKQNIKRLKEELAIDATQDGLWDWNCLTNEVYFSTRWKEMLGYEDHEIKNDLEEWKSRVHPDDLDQALSDLQKHFNGEEDYYVNEHRLRCKDGSYKWILDRGKAIFDDEKKPLRMSGFHTDITTRKLLEDQLRLMEKNLSTQLTMELSNKMKLKHTNKELEAQLHQEIIKRQEKEEMLLVQTRQAAMGEMISMIAHQWRQPITIIGLGVDNTLLDIALGKVDEKDLEENLNMIRQQVDYLSQTIDDFKNFFTPNKEKELVSLRTCIDASLNIIGKSLFQHSVEIQKDYNDNSTLELFKNEVIQVFLNILKNSQDVFIQKQIVNPKLIIQTSEDEKNIIVKIQDNGGGIDPQYIEKIYEPYFTSKSKYNGTGLGLYMTKTIIEDHCCGKITATNKNDGVEFEILFPKHCNKNNLQH